MDVLPLIAQGLNDKDLDERLRVDWFLTPLVQFFG